MRRYFKITQRHYGITIKQAIDNFPKEAGGFIGGKDDVIKAILPVHNQHLFNKTDTYAITLEDILRSHQFFKKHNLDYLGPYHSHPNGAAYPSETDINTGQKYHFIVGLKDINKPILEAFEIKARKVIPIPIQIVSNKLISVVDIHAIINGKEKKAPKNMFDEAEELSQQVDNIIKDKSKYDKLDPKTGYEASDFSTFA